MQNTTVKRNFKTLTGKVNWIFLKAKAKPQPYPKYNDKKKF